MSLSDIQDVKENLSNLISRFDPHLLNMSLHLERCVERLVAVFARRQVVEVKVHLFVGVNMTLDMQHGRNIGVEHLVTVPALVGE